ncbi:MAG: 50S ribosome-binding GTPase [Promethearchaeota archaeon]|nr:MAG: 50S ribosome-binding GTPase [Candidatus Lokiarchaeota archaeon]
MATKVTFVGKPEVGKTTIKKVILEGEDPNELIMFPLEATIGIQYSLHDFMDLKVSLLDSPGQSLPVLLEDEQKQLMTFGDTGAIIYIFDYPNWIENSQDIIDDIKKIYEIRNKLEVEAKIVLFLHKIDLLIHKKIGSMLALIRRQVIKQLNLPEELPIYFTSLHPNLIYTVYNAISDIFSNFSKDSSQLKEIIKNIIHSLSKTICVVSNQKNNLIIQVSSSDFDSSILYYLYEGIYKSNKLSEESHSKSKFINAGSKILYMVGENISNYHPNFNDILIFSEVLQEEDLKKLIEQVKEELDQHYN